MLLLLLLLLRRASSPLHRYIDLSYTADTRPLNETLHPSLPPVRPGLPLSPCLPTYDHEINSSDVGRDERLICAAVYGVATDRATVLALIRLTTLRTHLICNRRRRRAGDDITPSHRL